jgi:hypothetical protein
MKSVKILGIVALLGLNGLCDAARQGVTTTARGTSSWLTRPTIASRMAAPAGRFTTQSAAPSSRFGSGSRFMSTGSQDPYAANRERWKQMARYDEGVVESDADVQYKKEREEREKRSDEFGEFWDERRAEKQLSWKGYPWNDPEKITRYEEHKQRALERERDKAEPEEFKRERGFEEGPEWMKRFNPRFTGQVRPWGAAKIERYNRWKRFEDYSNSEKAKQSMAETGKRWAEMDRAIAEEQARIRQQKTSTD